MNDFQSELDKLRGQHLFRELTVLSGRQGVHVTVGGRSFINFAGNDYLGLATHPEVIRATIESLQRFGLGSGASRLMSGTYSPHEELERDLARFKRTDSALVFSSGYLANLAVLSSLPERGDVLFLDRLCHASLVDAARLGPATLRVFPHNDVTQLRRHLTRRGAGRRFIVTEGVFSMDGDRAPLAELVDLAGQTDSWLLLDDAHGIGCLGPTGGGLLEELGIVPTERIIQVGTLSKAIGAVGGFVAGSRSLRDWLVNRARPFIYTTAIPPAVCAGARRSLELLQSSRGLREQLWRNVAHLRRGLAALRLNTGNSDSQIIPVILGDAAAALELAARCREAGLFVPAIRPPTVPAGSSRLRISVSALHVAENLDRLLSVIAAAPKP